MAGVDLGGGRPKKQAKGGLKRPKHRVAIRIDMTPMVDIAFLLLIFYMVTTIFSSPLSMEISLPPKPEPGQEEVAKPVGQSFLLQIFVDKTDSAYYQIGEGMKQPSRINYPELYKIINEKNRAMPDKLVMVLKLDQNASYKRMVNIINAIQGVEREINAERKLAQQADPSIPTFSVRFSLQDMTAWDEHVLEVVQAGGTVEE